MPSTPEHSCTPEKYIFPATIRCIYDAFPAVAFGFFLLSLALLIIALFRDNTLNIVLLLVCPTAFFGTYLLFEFFTHANNFMEWKQREIAADKYAQMARIFYQATPDGRTLLFTFMDANPIVTNGALRDFCDSEEWKNYCASAPTPTEYARSMTIECIHRKDA